MTVRQAAARLEVSPALVYQLIASGKLGCHRIGNGRGVIRIAEAHLQAYLVEAESEPVRGPAPSPPPAPLPRLKHITLR
jgi:excisionase family DNA binding protein